MKSNNLIPAKNMIQVLKETCRLYGVTTENMRGKSRTKMLVQARRTFAKSAYEKCGVSQSEIGKALGDRNRSTVFYYLYGKKQRDNVPKDLHTEIDPELDPKM